MAITVNVNGVPIQYPQTGDPNWGENATNFAIQTSAALGKIGLSSGTSVDIPQTLDVTGNTTLDANLSVGGNLTVNGNTQLGNANTDTIGVTGIVNVDSGVLYIDPVGRVGINDTTPSQALDVNGNSAITGNQTVGGTLSVTGDVEINTNKFNVTASSGNTTIAGTLLVAGNTTVNGVIYADDNTTANTPVISFTSDTNTGIGRSAADTLDFITNGNSRFRIESTGQIKAVYESQVGTDYNTQLDNGYLCRAWVNFNGTGTVAIRASGNVSSITDNGTGDYTVNFTTAMPDANYSALVNVGAFATSNWGMHTTVLLGAKSISNFIGVYSTTQMSIIVVRQTAYSDENLITVGIFR